MAMSHRPGGRISVTDSGMTALAAETRAIYIRHGVTVDRDRHKGLFEKIWLDRFLDRIPAGGTILDVGCGAGEPIAAYFIAQGYALTGIDFPPPVIDIARRRFPDQRWIVADMRKLGLGCRFDGLIAWHSFFHLTKSEQREALRGFAAHLSDGGVMLLTVGPRESEVVGNVCGDPVYHASLSLEGYQEILTPLDMTVIDFVPEDPGCDFASVLLARKRPVGGRGAAGGT